MIKGILFDFNGTMVFDAPKHKEAWDEFSIQYRNKPLTEDELTRTHGLTNKEIIPLLLGKSISDTTSEELSKHKEALYRDLCRKDPSFALVDGLKELLDECKAKNIPMTICSASIKDNIDFFIDYFNLENWFDINKIVYDDGSHINKVTMFQQGADNIQVPIHECLIIEDSISGIAFAHKCSPASIIAITSPTKFEEYKKMQGVDKVIANYHCLLTTFQ